MLTFGEYGWKVYGNSLCNACKPPVSLKLCQSRSFCWLSWKDLSKSNIKRPQRPHLCMASWDTAGF